MERKYRQRGYMDKEWEDRKKARRDRPQRDRLPDAPRGHRHAMDRDAKTVLRCAACGHQIAGILHIGSRDVCAGCGAALHACRNCRHFDSGARFQCRKPIERAIGDKTKANDCSEFSPRQVLDATGRRADTAPRNARAAFDALFKKK